MDVEETQNKSRTPPCMATRESVSEYEQSHSKGLSQEAFGIAKDHGDRQIESEQTFSFTGSSLEHHAFDVRASE